jgi:hypothetical protein
VGSATDGSDELMDVWAKVRQEARDWGLESYYTKEKFLQLGNVVHKLNPGDQKTIEFHAISEKACPLFDLHIIQAMIAWYKQPWFSRVWVMQEAALGPVTIFVYGDKRVPVELVMLARQIFDFSGGYNTAGPPERTKAIISLLRDPAAAFFSIRRRRRSLDTRVGTGDSLYQLLQKLYIDNYMQATDLRDRI